MDSTMKPGDLVRINLPERVRSVVGYYYHGYVALVLCVNDPNTDVLLDGVVRCFASAYLEVIDETG